MMRGLVLKQYGSFEGLEHGEIPEPVTSPDTIIVEVNATAVNFADTLLVSGNYQFKPQLPFVPGKCPAGKILSVGKNINGFLPGDRVLTLADIGGFGERVAVTPSLCFALPDSLSFTDAASMASVFDTAWIALRERAFMQEGDTVLVLGGSSGIGLAATQLAKSFGGKVLSAIANPSKSKLVRATGADSVLDCSNKNLDSLRDQIMDRTGGKGADIVIDVLGGDVFDAAIRAVAWDGRVVVVGFASGRIQSIKASYILVKNISVSGMQISDYHRKRPQTTKHCWNEIFSLYRKGALSPLPTVVWPLERAPEALAVLQSRTAAGRIVLQQEGK